MTRNELVAEALACGWATLQDENWPKSLRAGAWQSHAAEHETAAKCPRIRGVGPGSLPRKLREARRSATDQAADPQDLRPGAPGPRRFGVARHSPVLAAGYA